MAMKYSDLSSWEISTHTLTRLQIRSPTNSPPGFPPKHSLGMSTLTFIVSLEGSPLLGLSGTYHPNSKFQWVACSFRWSSLLMGSTRRNLAARITGYGHAEILCLKPANMLHTWYLWSTTELSSGISRSFCCDWGSQCSGSFCISLTTTLRYTSLYQHWSSLNKSFPSLICSILNVNNVDQPQGLTWACHKENIQFPQVYRSRLDEIALAEGIPSWCRGVAT